MNIYTYTQYLKKFVECDNNFYMIETTQILFLKNCN